MTSQTNGAWSRPTVLVAGHDGEGAELLRTLFELDGRFTIMAVTLDLASAVTAVTEFRPTAVVLDLGLDEEPTTAVAAIHQSSPDSLVVVLSVYPDPSTLLDVLAHGATGYLDATRSWSEMVPAVAELCS